MSGRVTREFKMTQRARVARDPTYRKELLPESVACLLTVSNPAVFLVR